MKNAKQQNQNILSVCVIASIVTGCASITGTENQSVSVQTRTQAGKEVSGAACELSNNKGKWFVTTPGSISIHRSNDDMQVICKKDDQEPGRASVVSETKGSMFGNIIFGGGIGAIIDHNKGTAYEYPNFIQVVMGLLTKIDPPATEDDRKALQEKADAMNSVRPAAVEVAKTDGVPTKSTEEKLKELKRLKDAGLIENEAYIAQQKRLLEKGI